MKITFSPLRRHYRAGCMHPIEHSLCKTCSECTKTKKTYLVRFKGNSAIYLPRLPTCRVCCPRIPVRVCLYTKNANAKGNAKAITLGTLPTDGFDTHFRKSDENFQFAMHNPDSHYKDIHRRTIEIVQRNRTLEDNCCLKVYNAHIKLASPISG